MKKILCLALTAAMLPVHGVFAYDKENYQTKASEISALIAECEEKGINVQYEKIDSNILNVYAGRIQDLIDNGLDSSITDFQASELDSLYNSAKTNLQGYLNGTKKPMPEVYEYKTGDKLTTKGQSVLNPDGDPYFSIGFGHFNNTSYQKEFDSYGYDNLQFEVVPEAVLKANWTVPSWNAPSVCSVAENAGVTGNALRIKTEAGSEETRIYQRTRVQPQTVYKLTFKMKGSGKVTFTNGVWQRGGSATATSEWKEYSSIFSTVNNQDYALDLEFLFSGENDIYIDDVSLVPVLGEQEMVLNGDFEYDGTYGSPFFSDQSNTWYARRILKNAEESNQNVCILINVLYSWPEEFRTKFPEAFDETTGTMILTNPTAKKILENYISSLGVILDGFSSLSSICLTNESNYITLKYPAFNTEFREYLKDVHGNIATLNSRYGTSYSDFSEITMPTAEQFPYGGHKTYEEVTTTDKLFYDWKKFNDKTFADWHSYAADLTRKAFPGKPVHAKALSEMRDVDWDGTRDLDMMNGVDLELFDGFSDWTGNDGGAYLEETNYRSLENVMKWYDYLNSISDKPIYNSEDHITIDKGTTFNEKQAKFTSGSLWQGAIHGKDFSTIWIWSATTDTSSVGFGHMYLRPGAISAVAKTKLDLNRLSNEVTEISNKVPDIGILMTDTSRIYSASYMNMIDIIYSGAIKSGNKVGFFSEKTAQDRINRYGTIIIPRALYVERQVLDKISEYIKAGGKVIIVGNDSLKKNEYNQSHDSALINSIYNNSTVISAVKASKSKMTSPTVDDMQKALMNKLKLTDENGVALSDVEWQSTTYRSGKLVSVFNYDKTNSKKFVISNDGNRFDNVKELVSREMIDGAYEIEPLGYALFYVYNDSDFVNDIKTISGTRENGVNKISWEPIEDVDSQYYVFKVLNDGSLNFIKQTTDTDFAETSANPSAYVVKMKVKGKLTDGKVVSCEETQSITFTKTEEQTENLLKVSVSVANKNNYSALANLTATAYNEDGTFAAAREIGIIMPANQTSEFVFDFIVNGKGYIKYSK